MWVSDRAAGLDAIMLASTRELIAELNRRARDHRLNGNVPHAVVRLADGNQASVGDVIITRANDRRLRIAAPDCVKNGDRWTITRIGRPGDLTVRHNRSQLTVQRRDRARSSGTATSRALCYDLPGVDGKFERGVVALVLVGVGFCKPRHGAVETVAGAEVACDCAASPERAWARASVQPQRPA